MTTMLAIARPNPLPSPRKKESSRMLRRVQSHNSVSAGAHSRPHSTMSRASASHSRSRTNPAQGSLRDALAQARANSRRMNPMHESASHSHGGTTLQEALARAEQRRRLQDRSNPTVFGRSNPSHMGSTVSLRGLLEEHARKNGMSAMKRVRKNEATGLIERDKLLEAYRDKKTAYDAAVTNAQKSPTPKNKMIVARQRKVLEDFKRDVDGLESAYGVKAPRKMKRKAGTTKRRIAGVKKRTSKSRRSSSRRNGDEIDEIEGVEVEERDNPRKKRRRVGTAKRKLSAVKRLSASRKRRTTKSRRNGDEVEVVGVEERDNPRKKRRRVGTAKRRLSAVKRLSASRKRRTTKSRRNGEEIDVVSVEERDNPRKKRRRVGTAKRKLSAAKRLSASRKRRATKGRRNGAACATPSVVGRDNPRKKRRVSATKRKTSVVKKSRGPKSSSALRAHAVKSGFYKKLRSEAHKKSFIAEFGKLFAKFNRGGVTEAQASARAALAAYAKVGRSGAARKNPTVFGALENPRKRKSKSKSKSKSRTRRVVSSKKKPTTKIGASLEAMAKSSKLYAKLKPSSMKSAFIMKFKTAYNKMHKGKTSVAQASARAALSAYSQVTRGGTRKNPYENPRSKSRSSSSRKSSSRRGVSSQKARAKRLKPEMRKSAIAVLSKYTPYEYRVVMDGKVVEMKVNKSSAEYVAAKKRGLGSVKLSKLSGKKNTPTSLNLRSVYKTVDGRPSRKDFQRAINAWAGALDGGHIRGVSKRDISRTRMNGAHLRSHSVHALSNPAPLSLFVQEQIAERQNAAMSGGDKAKIAAIGAISGVSSLYLSNMVSSVLGYTMDVTKSDYDTKSMKFIASEAIPAVAAAIPLTLAVLKNRKDPGAVSAKKMALAGGIFVGALGSLLARTLLPKSFGRTIGLKAVAEAGSDVYTFEDAVKAPSAPTPQKGYYSNPMFGQYLLDSQPENAPISSLRGIPSMKGSNMRHNPMFGRFVTENAAQQSLGRLPAHSMGGIARGGYPVTNAPAMGGIARGGYPVTNAPAMGLYQTVPVNTMGGVYQDAQGNNIGMEYATMGKVRRNPVVPVAEQISPVGANTQMVPNRAPAVPTGMFDVDYKTLKEDLDLYEPLDADELAAEGLDQVYANGAQMRVLRAVPDVARQVVEANFGSIIGPSRAVPGSILVLASLWDHPQDHSLTNTLRLNRAPETPKGASYPAPGGIFSRVAFSSLFPSASNQAAFQEYGVFPSANGK